MRKYQSPNEAILEPIEKASRDELQALQLQRLKWSISHTYALVMMKEGTQALIRQGLVHSQSGELLNKE